MASIRLPQRINWADAMELLLTGERFDAERGQAMGLVWKVVPTTPCSTRLVRWPTRLLNGAPLAQRVMKEMATRTRHMPALEAIRFGETMRIVAGRTHDAAEGPRASMERRPPAVGWEMRRRGRLLGGTAWVLRGVRRVAVRPRGSGRGCPGPAVMAE